MFQPTVDLLNSLSAEQQQELVEILKDKTGVKQDEKKTLKELMIMCYGEDEEDVYNCLVDEIELMK